MASLASWTCSQGPCSPHMSRTPALPQPRATPARCRDPPAHLNFLLRQSEVVEGPLVCRGHGGRNLAEGRPEVPRAAPAGPANHAHQLEPPASPTHTAKCRQPGRAALRPLRAARGAGGAWVGTLSRWVPMNAPRSAHTGVLGPTGGPAGHGSTLALQGAHAIAAAAIAACLRPLRLSERCSQPGVHTTGPRFAAGPS